MLSPRADRVAPLLKRLDQAQICPHEWWSSCVSSHLFCVGLRLFLHVVRFGARCLDQESVPFRRGKVSHRPMRLEDGLEHDFVEALLLDLAVCFGLGHCRRSAGSFVLLGSAGGSSELPSVSLLFCAHSVFS